MFFEIFSRNGQARPFHCPDCGQPLRERNVRCPKCGAVNDEAGWRIPGKNQCGNCHEPLDPRDRYCKCCGTKAGEGKYKPYQVLMQCIYGPMPVSRGHLCPSCGYRWSTCRMIDRDQFCPRCGSPTVEGRPWILYLSSVNLPEKVELSIDHSDFLLGRSKACDGVLDFSQQISREHCRIIQKEDQCFLVDLNSHNGTQINGQPLQPGTEYPLNIGDRVDIAGFEFIVRDRKSYGCDTLHL